MADQINMLTKRGAKLLLPLLHADLVTSYVTRHSLIKREFHCILVLQDVYGPDFPGETFRVLKEKELRFYGEYRTRCFIL